METPPPYAPPRKKSNTGLIIALVLGGIAVCCIGGVGLLIGGGFLMFNKVKGFANCAISYEEVRQAVDAYTKDHNGTLPKAETWQDDVKPYLTQVNIKKEDLGPFERLKPEGDWGCKQDDGTVTGMAYNDTVSGKKLTEIQDPYSTVMIFEVEKAGRNLHEQYKPRGTENSPKIFGEHRGWFEMPVIGKARSSKNGKNIDFNISDN